MARRGTKKTVVERAESFPPLASEEAESHFWAAHELGEDMLKDVEPFAEGVLPTARTSARPVSARFEPSCSSGFEPSPSVAGCATRRC